MSKLAFISHSSKDKELVDLFVDEVLVKGIELRSKQIFCTSMEGLGIKTGDDFVKRLKKELSSCKIAILLISKNYKASEICLNEMGAAWALSKKVFPFIVEPLECDDVGIIHRNNNVAKLNSKSDLDNFRDAIIDALDLDNVLTGRWNAVTTKFLKSYKTISLPDPQITIAKDDYLRLEKEKDELQDEYNELYEEKEKQDEYISDLLKLKDREEAKKLKIQYHESSSSMEEFDETISEINKLFEKIDNYTVTKTILAEYYNVPADLDYDHYSGYREKIDDAIRRRYLTDEYATTRKKPIPEIEELLSQLSTFDELETFYEEYEEEYRNEFDPKDQDFWNRHFDY